MKDKTLFISGLNNSTARGTDVGSPDQENLIFPDHDDCMDAESDLTVEKGSQISKTYSEVMSKRWNPSASATFSNHDSDGVGDTFGKLTDMDDKEFKDVEVVGIEGDETSALNKATQLFRAPQNSKIDTISSFKALDKQSVVSSP